MSDNQLPPADIPVDQYTREQAGAVLNKMSEDYRKAHPGDEWTAGEEHATGTLKRMEKDPHRVSDPVETGLTGGLPSGTMVPFGPGEGEAIAAQKLADMINNLREDLGMSDPVIREALEPHKHSVTPAEMEAALRLESQLHGDREWRTRLLQGDQRAREQLMLLEVIKGLPVKAKVA